MNFWSKLFGSNACYDAEVVRISKLMISKVLSQSVELKTNVAIETKQLLKFFGENTEIMNNNCTGLTDMFVVYFLSKHPSEFLTAMILELNKLENKIGIDIIKKILLLIDNYMDVNANCKFEHVIDEELVKMYNSIKDLQLKMIGVLVTNVFMSQRKFSVARKIYKNYKLSKRSSMIIIEEISKLSTPEFARELTR